MVNPVVYDPRYGQFGELDARCDNYLGRGQFARINPGTGGKPKTMLAGKVLAAVKPCHANHDGVSGGLSTAGGIG